MPNNLCRNVVCLYELDVVSGNKELVKIFTSLKSARYYRRKHYYEEIMKKPDGSINDYWPIEKWRVTHQGDAYKEEYPEDDITKGSRY